MSEPMEKTDQEPEGKKKIPLKRGGLVKMIDVASWAAVGFWAAASVCVFAGTTWEIPVGLAQAGFWSFFWLMVTQILLWKQDGKELSPGEIVSAGLAYLLILNGAVWIVSFFGITMKADPTGGMIAFFISVTLPLAFFLLVFFVSLWLEERPEYDKKSRTTSPPGDDGPYDWKDDPALGSAAG